MRDPGRTVRAENKIASATGEQSTRRHFEFFQLTRLRRTAALHKLPCFRAELRQWPGEEEKPTAQRELPGKWQQWMAGKATTRRVADRHAVALTSPGLHLHLCGSSSTELLVARSRESQRLSALGLDRAGHGAGPGPVWVQQAFSITWPARQHCESLDCKRGPPGPLQERF